MRRLKDKLKREPTESERTYWQERGRYIAGKQRAAEIRNIKKRIARGNERAGDQTRLAQLKGTS